MDHGTNFFLVSRYGLHRFYAHWRIHGRDRTLDSPVCAAAAQSRRMCARGDSPRTAPARRVRRAGVDSLHGAQRWVQAVFAAPCPNETPHPLQRLAAPPVSRAAHRIDTAGTSKHTLFRAFTVLADCKAGAFCKVQKCDSFEGWTYVCGICMPCAACGCDAHSTSGSCPTERCPGSPFLVRRGRPLRSLTSLPALRAPSRKRRSQTHACAHARICACCSPIPCACAGWCFLPTCFHSFGVWAAAPAKARRDLLCGSPQGVVAGRRLRHKAHDQRPLVLDGVVSCCPESVRYVPSVAPTRRGRQSEFVRLSRRARACGGEDRCGGKYGAGFICDPPVYIHQRPARGSGAHRYPL